MKKIILPILASVFFAAACSSGTKTVTNNYYDDGIYYDRANDQGSFTLGDIQNPEETTTTNPDASSSGDLDYYNPDDNSTTNQNAAYSSNGGNTVINNYYGVTYRYPSYNTGLYWNSWGGWGFNVSYGWGSPYYYYDPYFYDPWYSPYYCYSCYYRPYWAYHGWYPGYGYNSYWAGFYQGYYYGSVNGGNDYFGGGRNVTYVRNVSTASRTNSFNSLNANRGNYHKSSAGGNGRVYTREENMRSNNSDARNTRALDAREAVASSRFNDRNLTADNTPVSRRVASPDQSTRIEPGNINRQNYKPDSYNYIRSRATDVKKEPTRASEQPVATSRAARSAEVRENNFDSRSQRSFENYQQNKAKSNIRTNTNSYSREQYNRNNNGNIHTTTPIRSNSDNRTVQPRNSGNDNIYVPSEKRSRNYNPSGVNRNYTPSRSSTPSRSTPSRSYNNDSNSRSYTPSSSSPSRSYTPSSSSPSRNYTPSSSGSSRSSSSPSRSSSSSSRTGRGR